MRSYTLGRWLILAGAFVAAAIYVGLSVEASQIHPWLTEHRVALAAIGLGAMTWAAIALFRRPVVRHEVQQASKAQGLEPPETASQAILEAKAGAASAVANLLALRSVLRAQRGLRWRARLPWLLLTGDDAAIGRLVPGLNRQGWLITPDAVLLWSKAGKDGQPDIAWLTQLYKLHRRRPIDAVLVTVDGETSLSAQRHTTHPYPLTLARIAETLRWSAPVFLIDVAQENAAPDGDGAPVGCELPRQWDADTVRRALTHPA